MEDLEEDIRLMRELYKDREAKGEITHYVLLENAGLLENELAGVQYLQKQLENVPPDVCGHIDELATYVGDYLKVKCEESDYPDGVYDFIDKRIQKVLKYMKEM